MCLGAACGRWDAGWPDTIDPGRCRSSACATSTPARRSRSRPAGVGTGVPEDGPVYVHLDLDGLDPSVHAGAVPGAGRAAGVRGRATCWRRSCATAGSSASRSPAFEHPEHLDLVLEILEPVTALSIWITELGPGSLAVKDLFDTAGVRTTYGSPIFADHVPAATAEAVRRLERLHDGRQGEPARVRLGHHLRERDVRDGAEPDRAGPDRRRLERRLRRGAGRRAGRLRARAPTRAARSGSRPRAAGWSASSRPAGSSRSTAASR